jgi:hypothetical protein
VRQALRESALANQKAKQKIPEGDGDGVQCPPFCGEAHEDKGDFASVDKNDEMIEDPGESGIYLPKSSASDDKMLKARIRSEVVDEVDSIKRLLQILSKESKGSALFSVHGSLSVSDCTYFPNFRKAGNGKAIKQALGNAGNVDAKHVYLTSVSPVEDTGSKGTTGLIIEYSIEPQLEAEEANAKIAQSIADAFQSGSLGKDAIKIANDLIDDESKRCIGTIEIGAYPAVKRQEPLDLTNKLSMMHRLEDLIGVFKGKDDEIPMELLGDIDDSVQLTKDLQVLREELGVTDMDAIDTTSQTIEGLERLVELLMEYLKPATEAGLNKQLEGFSRARRELGNIYQKLKAARDETKCRRVNPNDPVPKGCEHSQMPSTMRLRDYDDEFPEGADPILQKEYGAALNAVDTAEDKKQDPPVTSTVDYMKSKEMDADSFWMPDASREESGDRFQAQAKATEAEKAATSKHEPAGGNWDHGLLGFDRIFYINLDRNTDRKAEIEAEFKALGYEPDSIERVVGVDVAPSWEAQAKSHLRAIKTAQQRGYKNIVILEDDFRFMDEFHKSVSTLTTYVNDAMNYVGNDWDVLLLTGAATHDELLGSSEADAHHLARVSMANAGSGYAINQRFYATAAQYMARAAERNSKVPFDTAWQTLQNDASHKWYRIQPKIGMGKWSSVDLESHVD